MSHSHHCATILKGYDGEMSSTGTLRSTKYGSVASLDSMRSDPFSKSPRMSRKQIAMEDIPEGPSKSLLEERIQIKAK